MPRRAEGFSQRGLCPRCEPEKARDGFTLIEAAVAIAIIAILAGAIAPLAVKALNQQREFKTRDGLKAAFEGMFGARDRRVANMRADFGFNPGDTLTDLSGMVVNAGVPGYAVNASGLFWGWNGPYWNGSLDSSSRPLDAWGRPMQLRWFPNPPQIGWQVFSLGSNGVNDSGASTTPLGDDLGYPVVPANPLGFTAVLNLVINNNGGYSGASAYVWVNSRNGGALVRTLAAPSDYLDGSTPQTFTYQVIAGGVEILVHWSDPSFDYTQNFVADLLPGEVRQFEVTLP